MQDSELLRRIVNSWDIKPEPEYRGFRCANCQRYINESYYHWLQDGQYYVPVHFCTDCQSKFLSGELRQAVLPSNSERDLTVFNKQYSLATQEVFESIVTTWKPAASDAVTIFYCDKCGSELDIDPANGQRKGYHVWWLHDARLHELHFHRDCGDELVGG